MTQRGGRPKSSEYRGVAWHKRSGKWQAHIYCDGKLHYLGIFDKERDAAIAYDDEAWKTWGADAFVNFPKRRAKRVERCERLIEEAVTTLVARAERLPMDPEARRRAIREAIRRLGEGPVPV